MSRSTYVYVIRSQGGAVLGTWTVKQEMAAWLDQNRAVLSSTVGLIQISRHRDGEPWLRPVDLNPRTLEPAV